MPNQAVTFDGSTDRYTRTLSPAIGTQFTIAFWGRVNALRGDYSTFWGLDNGSQTDAIAMQLWDSPADQLVVATNGGTDLEIHSVNPGTWYCYSFTRSALSGSSAIRVRYGTSPSNLTAVTASPSGAFASSTYNTLRMSHSGWGAEWLDGSIAFLKVYTRVLTDAEIEAELSQYNPASTDGLYAAYSFWDGPSTADLSGNGRTLTAGGSLTAGSGPSGVPQTVVVEPPADPPGSVFDLSDWKLTLPVDDPNDPGDALEVRQPELDTYADEHFYLDDQDRMVFEAPVQGGTTPGSGATRSELREMEGDAEAAWTPFDEGVRQLTVTERVDPTSLTDRQEIIIGQIHAGAQPAIYLAAEWESSGNPVTPRIRIFKDRADGSGGSSGVANLLSGQITTTTDFTWRIRVENETVSVYAAVGTAANLPSTPAHSFDATADFDDDQGWYFKLGAYNKSEVADGGTGAAVVTVSYVELLQPGDEPVPTGPEPGRFMIAYA